MKPSSEIVTAMESIGYSRARPSIPESSTAEIAKAIVQVEERLATVERIVLRIAAELGVNLGECQ